MIIIRQDGGTYKFRVGDSIAGTRIRAVTFTADDVQLLCHHDTTALGLYIQEIICTRFVPLIHCVDSATPSELDRVYAGLEQQLQALLIAQAVNPSIQTHRAINALKHTICCVSTALANPIEGGV